MWFALPVFAWLLFEDADIHAWLVAGGVTAFMLAIGLRG